MDRGYSMKPPPRNVGSEEAARFGEANAREHL
jgi:hypothetical protein